MAGAIQSIRAIKSTSWTKSVKSWLFGQGSKLRTSSRWWHSNWRSWPQIGLGSTTWAVQSRILPSLDSQQRTFSLCPQLKARKLSFSLVFIKLSCKILQKLHIGEPSCVFHNLTTDFCTYFLSWQKICKFKLKMRIKYKGHSTQTQRFAKTS